MKSKRVVCLSVCIHRSIPQPKRKTHTKLSVRQRDRREVQLTGSSYLSKLYNTTSRTLLAIFSRRKRWNNKNRKRDKNHGLDRNLMHKLRIFTFASSIYAKLISRRFFSPSLNIQQVLDPMCQYSLLLYPSSCQQE